MVLISSIISVGQKRPSNWQRNQRENFKNYDHSNFKKPVSSTLPADFPPTYPSGSLSPGEEDFDQSLLQTAPAVLQVVNQVSRGDVERGFPQSVSASNLDSAKTMHNSLNPRPYKGPKAYQSMSALNTAGLDNGRKPSSVYQKLNNTGFDFSPKKQQNPRSNEVRNIFASREKENQQYSEPKTNTFQATRQAYQANYMNIPGVEEEQPPAVPPLPKADRLSTGPPPPMRNSSFRTHGKFPSWPVEGSQPESSAGPIDTPPVRDYNPNQQYSAAPYQPHLHTVKEKRSPIVDRKESENLMTAKQPDVYQARMAKVINTSQDEESLRHLLSTSKQGYPPPKVDNKGKEIGDQDYSVPSPPERDVSVPNLSDSNVTESAPQSARFDDLLKKYAAMDEESSKGNVNLYQKSNRSHSSSASVQKHFEQFSDSPPGVSSNVPPQTDLFHPATSHSPHSITVTRSQLQVSGAAMSAKTPSISPPRVAVDVETIQMQNMMTQTSPQAADAPWNSKTVFESQTQSQTEHSDVREFKDTSAQVSPPFSSPAKSFGLNSLVSERDLRNHEQEHEDATRIINKWELEREQREQARNVGNSTDRDRNNVKPVDVFSGHIRQYSENTAPMLHRLSNDVYIQQQIQNANRVAASSERMENHNRKQDNQIMSRDESSGVSHGAENEPIYATIEEHEANARARWQGVRHSLKDIAGTSNYVNMYPPNSNNYVNVVVEEDPSQTHPKALYAESIAREDRQRKGSERGDKSRHEYTQEISVPHDDNPDMLRTWHGYSNSYSAPKTEPNELYRIEEHERHFSEGRGTDVGRLRHNMPSRRISESKGLKRTTSEQIRPMSRDHSFMPVPNNDYRYNDIPKYMDETDSRRQPLSRNMEDVLTVRQSKPSNRSESYRERIQSDRRDFELRAETIRAEKKRPHSESFDIKDNQRQSLGSNSSEHGLKRLQKQALLNFYQSKTGTIDGSTTSLVSEEGSSNYDGTLPRSRPSSLSRDPRQVVSTSQLYPSLRRSDSVTSSQSRSGSNSSGGYSPNRMSWDRGDVFRTTSTSSMEKSPLSPVPHPQVTKLLRKHQSAMEMNVGGLLSPEDEPPRRRSSSGAVFEPNLQMNSGNTNKSHYKAAQPSLPSDDERPPLPPRNYRPNEEPTAQDMRRNDSSWEQRNEWHEFNLWRKKHEAQRNGYEQDWLRDEEKPTPQHDHNRNRSRGKSYENIYRSHEDDAYTRQLREQSRRMSQQSQPLTGPANYKKEMVLTKTKSEIIKSKPVDTRPMAQETYLPTVPPKEEASPEPGRPPKPRTSPAMKPVDARMYSPSPDLPPPPIEETDIDAIIMQDEESVPPPPPPKDYPMHHGSLGSLSNSPRASPKNYPAEISFPPPPPTNDTEESGTQTDDDEIDDYPENSYMAIKTSKSRNRYNGPGNYVSSPTSERPLLSTAPASLDSFMKQSHSRLETTPPASRTPPVSASSPHSSAEHSPRSSPVAVQLIKSPRASVNTSANTSYTQLTPVGENSPVKDTLLESPSTGGASLFKPIENTSHNLPPKGNRRYSEQPVISKRSPVDSAHNRRQSMENPRRSGESSDRLPWLSANSSISESTESLEGAFTARQSENLRKSEESLSSTKHSTESLSKMSDKDTSKSGGSSPVIDDKLCVAEPILTIKHIRHKSQEELECEKEAARLADQIKEKDSKLSQVLSPDEPPKTASDYMEGVVEIDPVIQHRRQSSAGKSSSSPKSTSPKPPSDGRNSMTPTGDKITDSPIPVTSPYWHPTPSSKNTCFVDELSESGDLHKKKEELASRIQKKLDALLSQKDTLDLEASEVEELGTKVLSMVESRCTNAEIEKYNLYVDESQKVVKLLLKLSGWLAKAENQLSSLPEDASKEEKNALLQKKERYAKQHEDARALKEGIDKRRSQVSGFLEKCLSSQEFDDFKHFTKTRLTLTWEMKDLDDSIQMGRDQLKELKKSMESSP